MTTSLWADRQFWGDATERAFRTFCQTLEGGIAAVLASTVVGDGDLGQAFGGWKPWALILFAAAVAALRSFLSAASRERAVIKAGQAPAPATVVVNNSHTLPVEPAGIIVQDGHGGSLR